MADEAPVTPETPPTATPVAPVTQPATPAPEPKSPEPTLAEGGGEPDKTQEVPSNYPANWREIMAGGNDKELQRLKRYASPANIWKAYRAIEQKLSTGELLRSKPDGKDEQALNEWRAQLGIPENPDGYLEKLPDGVVVGENDKPVLDDFVKEMHAADAPPDLVRKAVGWYFQNQEKLAAQRHEQDKTYRAQSEDVLRAEWGPEFRANQNAVRSLLDTYGNDEIKEKLFSARSGDGNALGDNPEVMKFFTALARELNPAGTVTPASGQTVSQSIESELAALEKEMSQPRSADPNSYWRSETKQARYRELLQAREKVKGRAA